MEGDGQQRPLSAPSLPGRGFLNGAPILVAQKVCVSVYKGITTGEIGGLAADIAAAMTTSHPDYASLAARIAVSNLHKNTLTSFSATGFQIGGASPPRSPQPWFADRKASLRRTPFPSPGDSSTSSSAASTSMSTRSQKVKDTLENVFPSEKELMMPRLPHLLLFYYSTHHYVHLIAPLDPKFQSSKAWV